MKNIALAVVILIAATPLVAQNLISNGSFDTDLAGWTVTTSTNATVGWVSRDADDSGASGSVEATNLLMNGGSSQMLWQCFEGSEGDEISFDLMVYQPSGQPGEGWGGCRSRLYDGPGCTGSVLDYTFCSKNAPQGSFDQWLPVSRSCMLPAGSASVMVILAVTGVSGGTSFTADFDNVVISNTAIFADGFESGNTSGWTSQIP